MLTPSPLRPLYPIWLVHGEQSMADKTENSHSGQTKTKIAYSTRRRQQQRKDHDDKKRKKTKLCFKPVSNWELLWGSVTFCVGIFIFVGFLFLSVSVPQTEQTMLFFFLLRVSGRFSVSTTTPPTARNGGHKFALPYTQTKTSFKDFYLENIWNFFFGIIFH